MHGRNNDYFENFLSDDSSLEMDDVPPSPERPESKPAAPQAKPAAANTATSDAVLDIVSAMLMANLMANGGRPTTVMGSPDLLDSLFGPAPGNPAPGPRAVLVSVCPACFFGLPHGKPAAKPAATNTQAARSEEPKKDSDSPRPGM